VSRQRPICAASVATTRHDTTVSAASDYDPHRWRQKSIIQRRAGFVSLLIDEFAVYPVPGGPIADRLRSRQCQNGQVLAVTFWLPRGRPVDRSMLAPHLEKSGHHFSPWQHQIGDACNPASNHAAFRHGWSLPMPGRDGNRSQVVVCFLVRKGSTGNRADLPGRAASASLQLRSVVHVMHAATRRHSRRPLLRLLRHHRLGGHQ
jgi:hypothetical protein